VRGVGEQGAHHVAGPLESFSVAEPAQTTVVASPGDLVGGEDPEVRLG
jgi:hypothetical protein